MRHERRRRWLPDDAPDVADAPSEFGSRGTSSTSDGSTPGSAALYADAGRHARQRGVHTLFPASWLSIVLAGALGVMLTATCAVLHVSAGKVVPPFEEVDVAWMRLDGPASLARWVASGLLAASAATGAFIYSLRRHRLDDYHGRYRAWIWMTMACLIAGVVESTGIARFARRLCQMATSSVNVDGSLVWSGVVALLVTALAVRLLFEIRKSKAAVTTLGLAATALVIAAATYHGWPLAFDSATLPLVGRSSWLTGYVLILSTFLLYGRHVQLDMLGRQAKPLKRRRKTAEDAHDRDQASQARKPALRLRTDLDPEEPARQSPPAKSPAAAVKPAPVQDSAVAGATHSHAKLSRAERRRQRRETKLAS
jgi:hypothetical protein